MLDPQTPSASRPGPREYFMKPDEGSGLLPWSHVTQRLERARNYWLATAAADGRPHSMPVWGIWRDGRFAFSTGPTTKKARNLAENPNASLHLENAAEVVVVECHAREIADAAALEAFRIVYNQKYAWDFTLERLSMGGVFELSPRTAFAWLGDEGEAFSGTATRWTFPASR